VCAARVSIRQHTSAYVSIRQAAHTAERVCAARGARLTYADVC
jgi:hypothetical protein